MLLLYWPLRASSACSTLEKYSSRSGRSHTRLLFRQHRHPTHYNLIQPFLRQLDTNLDSPHPFQRVPLVPVFH